MSLVRTLLRILLCTALALQGATFAGGRAEAAPERAQAMSAHHGCHDMAMRDAHAPMKHPPHGQGDKDADLACRAFCAWHCAAPLLPAVALQLLSMPSPEPAAAVVRDRPPPHLPDPIRPPIV